MLEFKRRKNESNFEPSQQPLENLPKHREVGQVTEEYCSSGVVPTSQKGDAGAGMRHVNGRIVSNLWSCRLGRDVSTASKR